MPSETSKAGAMARIQVRRLRAWKGTGPLSKVRQTMLVSTLTVNPALFCLTLVAPRGVEIRSTLKKGRNWLQYPRGNDPCPQFRPFSHLENFNPIGDAPVENGGGNFDSLRIRSTEYRIQRGSRRWFGSITVSTTADQSYEIADCRTGWRNCELFKTRRVKFSR